MGIIKKVKTMFKYKTVDYETIFNASTDGIAILDLDTNFLDFNDAYLEITGLTREELLNKSCTELTIECDKERSKQAFEELMRVGYVKKNFEKSCNINGKIITVNTSLTLLPDKRHILTVAKDITEQKQYQDSLKAANLRKKLALKAATIGIWEWNYDTNTLLWDDKMYEIYGIKKIKENETLPYSVWFNSVDEKDREMVESNLINAQKADGEYNAKFWIVTPSKEHKFIHAIGTSEYDQNGKPIRMVGINTDISEQKFYEQDLQRAVKLEIQKREEHEKLLIQQARMAMMGEMIGAIAHQWRQPLTSLGLIVQDIADAYSFNELDNVYIDNMVNKSIKHIDFMTDTIDDFKNFFKTEKSATTFDLVEAFRSILNMIEKQFYNNSIRVIKECSLGNKSSLDINNECMAKIKGFEGEFKQVILNILSNAQYALIDKREADREITIRMHEDSTHITISINDNAGGIPQEIIDRIFEPYFTTKGDKGTGIGLYMSKMIIEDSMKGKISVANNTRGAEFTIMLPKNFDNL